MTVGSSKAGKQLEPELAFASGDPKARHRHPLLGLSRFGAFDQASYRHYSRDLRVAYVGPRSGAALVRDMRESLRGPQRNTDNNNYAQAYPGFERLFGVDLHSADKQAHVVWPEELYDLGRGDTVSERVWAYATGAFENIKAVVYDFCESRSGEHARRFLGDWRGSLTCDDFSGYKALIASGVTEVGCLAHARRKFFELHAANQSQIAEVALQPFARVYEIEREVKEIATDQRQTIRQQQTKPLLDALHQWMVLQRQKVPEGSASAKALDYSLRRWEALTRFVDDGQLPVDNNWIENQIRPIAIGRNNWLFAGSLRAGQRAAAVMTLIQSARLNGHDPYAYLKDVLARLPTQRVSLVHELLPHRWFAPS